MLTILGIYLYQMILGEQQDSVKNNAAKIMKQQLSVQRIEP